MADLIALKHLDDRTDWLKIVKACASSSLYDLSVKLSGKSDKFEQAEHDAPYHSYTKRNITVGTLHHYAKLSQPDITSCSSFRTLYQCLHPRSPLLAEGQPLARKMGRGCPW